MLPGSTSHLTVTLGGRDTLGTGGNFTLLGRREIHKLQVAEYYSEASMFFFYLTTLCVVVVPSTGSQAYSVTPVSTDLPLSILNIRSPLQHSAFLCSSGSYTECEQRTGAARHLTVARRTLSLAVPLSYAGDVAELRSACLGTARWRAVSLSPRSCRDEFIQCNFFGFFNVGFFRGSGKKW